LAELSYTNKLRKIVVWAVSLAGAGATFIWAGLPILMLQLHTRGNLNRGGENWRIQFAATPLTTALGRSLVWREQGFPLLFAALLAALAVFWVPAVLFWSRAKMFAWQRLLLAGSVVLPILIPLMLAWMGKPIYMARYASVGLPAFALSFAAGLYSFPSLFSRRLLVIGAAGILTSVSLIRFATEPWKDDWRSAMSWMLTKIHTEDLIMVDADNQVRTLLHFAGMGGRPPAHTLALYENDEKHFFQGILYQYGMRRNSNSRDFESLARRAPFLWLVQCVPAHSEVFYTENLEHKGWRPALSYTAYRIKIISFAKATDR
jgi:hypothetical protein